ncbi:prepilin peptidase [Actinoplanes sp. NPDC023714]|uniref:prepilin peptidase n=1 Tax=Actinoplanes sp. NPDC023714 TaxID=3154322 RepID=UPI0033F8570D
MLPALSSILAAGALVAGLGPVPQLPALALAAVVGVRLAVIDLRCLRLPDPLVGLLALVAGLPLAVLRPSGLPVAVAAGALTGAAYLLLALLPGEGLGLGDVKLGAVLAFVLGFDGWPAVAVGLGAAHLINGVVAGWLLITRRAGGARALPFGPALLAGALIGLTAT